MSNAFADRVLLVAKFLPGKGIVQCVSLEQKQKKGLLEKVLSAAPTLANRDRTGCLSVTQECSDCDHTCRMHLLVVETCVENLGQNEDLEKFWACQGIHPKNSGWL